MKIAVITPYFREPLDLLRVCHQSVQRQSHPCDHFLVADGFPQPDLDSWNVQHIILAKSHSDNGNTPRSIGSLSAMNQGFDAVCYLDADNFYLPDHIAAMVHLHEKTNAAVCIASRTINRLDGSILFPTGRPTDGVQHVDTSCFFFTRAAYRLLPVWAMMPGRMGPVCDQMMWTVIQALDLSRAVEPIPTVAFRTQYAADYEAAGETPPPNAKTTEEAFIRPIKWWAELPKQERVDWERRMGLYP